MNQEKTDYCISSLELNAIEENHREEIEVWKVSMLLARLGLFYMCVANEKAPVFNLGHNGACPSMQGHK